MSVKLEDMSDYAKNLVKELHLEAHPEGGWYARDWQHRNYIAQITAQTRAQTQLIHKLTKTPQPALQGH